MISFAMPAGRPIVLNRRRTAHAVDCAPVVPTPAGSAATHWACRNCVSVWLAAGPPAKIHLTRNTDSHSAVALSMSFSLCHPAVAVR